MSARVWVIIPTYNEAENVERIIRAAAAELEVVRRDDYRILIVDDNSPDGTGRIADALSEELPCVTVLHRTEKNGLGQAYVAGFNEAIAAGAELLIEMDADFSHDPRHLPELLAAVEDADLVLGSRYVKGGAVVNWGPVRQVVSRGGGVYARTVLDVDIKDLTGGYKCIRREVLETIDLPTIKADGYVFQIEVTYRALLAGFRVVEVPIVFTDRTAGTSKMSMKIALEAFWRVPQLRSQQHRQVGSDAVRITQP